jgi:hypothetical protein
MTKQVVVNAVRAACDHLLSHQAALASVAVAPELDDLEDDWITRFGLVGFGTQVPMERWTDQHAQRFRQLHDEEFTKDVLEWHQEDAPAYERFGCLALGSIVALADMGALQDDDDMLIAVATAAGFMIEHANAIYRLPVQLPSKGGA